MRPQDPFFVADDAGFIAQPWTRGPWDPRAQHGGPPAALMLRAMELAAPDAQLARLTVEFLRSIPIARCELELEATRTGRRALGFACTLRADGRACARAHGLFLRDAPLAVPPGLPPSPAPRDPLVYPAHEFEFFGDRVGYHKAMELRRPPPPDGPGRGALWLRLRGRLVEGEDPSPAQRVVVAADAINGVGFGLDLARFSFPNADLSVYLHRLPESEWLLLETTHNTQASGRGLADGLISDPRGPIGRALESQVLEPRGAG